MFALTLPSYLNGKSNKQKMMKSQQDQDMVVSLCVLDVQLHGHPRCKQNFHFSFTEAECYGLSDCLRATMPLMEMTSEAAKQNLLPKDTIPALHCKAFEDNSGAMEMVRLPKIRPCTRHINVKCHHFRSFYKQEKISIEWCGTEDMLADMLSEAQKRLFFIKHCTIAMC